MESVCSVERLSEACSFEFHSIPVVNMAGRIIGIIPKSFIVVLIENHWWYQAKKVQHEEVTSFYASAMHRQDSRNGSWTVESPRVS